MKELDIEGIVEYRCFENPNCPVRSIEKHINEGTLMEMIPDIRAACLNEGMDVIDEKILPSFINEVGVRVAPKVPDELLRLILGEIVIADCSQLHPGSQSVICGSIIALSKDRFSETGPIRETIDRLNEAWNSRKKQ